MYVSHNKNHSLFSAQRELPSVCAWFLGAFPRVPFRHVPGQCRTQAQGGRNHEQAVAVANQLPGNSINPSVPTLSISILNIHFISRSVLFCFGLLLFRPTGPILLGIGPQDLFAGQSRDLVVESRLSRPVRARLLLGCDCGPATKGKAGR